MDNFTRGFLREEDLRPSNSMTENVLRMFSPIRIANALAPVGHDDEGNYSFALPSAIADPIESWKGMVDRHRGGIDDTEADVRDAFNVAGSVGVGSLAAAPLKPYNALGAFGKGIAKDLPMDVASRLARAKEMGFDTDKVWYHGTRSDFPEFSVKPESNRDIFGIHLGTKEQANDIVKNQSTIEKNIFGEWSENGKVLPLHVKEGNLLELSDLGKNNSWDMGQLRYELATRDIPFKGDIFNPTYEDIRRSLQDAGYDGIKYVNNFEGVKAHGPQESIMLFDPKNIRSVNAAFDPTKSDSANLLAANPSNSAAIALALNALRHKSPQDVVEFMSSHANIPTSPSSNDYDNKQTSYQPLRGGFGPRWENKNALAY